ncbi:DMT family transporter [Candidatus Micrarchaeota archaeon]|nr:DMT family transporter [Candidatus Micrarchaeota archaeon]
MFTFTWFEFALASTFFTAAFWLVCRNLMKTENDHAVFALLIQWVPLVFFLPFLAFETIRIPGFEGNVGSADASMGWFWLILAGVAWALQQVLVFKSLRFTSASVREPVYQTKLLWAALFAVLLAHEVPATGAWLGIALVLLGALVMAYRSPAGESSREGLILVLSSAALTGLAYVFDKLALAYSSVTAYALIVSVVSGSVIALHLTREGAWNRLLPFARLHVRTLLLASVTGALSYWLMVKAISVGPVGSVAAVFEIAMVLTTVGGIVLLGERQALGRKVLGMALAVVGALVLRGYLAVA